MSQAGGATESVRAAVFRFGLEATETAGSEVRDRIEEFNSTGTTGVEGSSSGAGVSTEQTLEVQFLVGNYTTLTQSTSQIERGLTQSISSTIRNYSQ